VFQGAGGDEQCDNASAMQAQDAGAFIGRGAGGHDIVDQHDVASGQVALAGKGTAYVALPFAWQHFGLGARWPLPVQQIQLVVQARPAGDAAGNLAGLVEAPLAQALRMQGHRQQ
jgi:hypothetical protein